MLVLRYFCLALWIFRHDNLKYEPIVLHKCCCGFVCILRFRFVVFSCRIVKTLKVAVGWHIFISSMHTYFLPHYYWYYYYAASDAYLTERTEYLLFVECRAAFDERVIGRVDLDICVAKSNFILSAAYVRYFPFARTTMQMEHIFHKVTHTHTHGAQYNCG